MKISVVISTYSNDNLGYVLKCIRSLETQSLQPSEVLLVLDPDPELVRFYESNTPKAVKIITSNNYGLSNARNAGVKNSDGEVVAFIDDDAVAHKDWLRELARNYRDPKVFGAGGMIKPLWETGSPKWFPEELNWVVGCSYKGLPENRALVRNPIGCNMSFRKEVFGKVGFFRSDVGRFGQQLLAGEESELSSRILKTISGAKIVYDPSAIVYHRIPRRRMNVRYILKRSFYEGLSKAIILRNDSSKAFAMSSEKLYSKYLLTTSIPSRLQRFYKIEDLMQLMALFISAAAVSIGFALGIVRGARL